MLHQANCVGGQRHKVQQFFFRVTSILVKSNESKAKRNSNKEGKNVLQLRKNFVNKIFPLKLFYFLWLT